MVAIEKVPENNITKRTIPHTRVCQNTNTTVVGRLNVKDRLLKLETLSHKSMALKSGTTEHYS